MRLMRIVKTLRFVSSMQHCVNRPKFDTARAIVQVRECATNERVPVKRTCASTGFHARRKTGIRKACRRRA
jgi:hypothetical protein